jgi:hypothetical protein
MENGLIKLIETLQRKRNTGDWIDSFADEGRTGDGIRE